MRVLVSGHNGYIGSVLVPVVAQAGHDVTGLDTFYYEECTFGPNLLAPAHVIRKDVRDVEAADLAGFDAVIHLAALSNDPLGDLSAGVTYDINHQASVRLARVAKDAGVGRYLFSSSCSLYGASGNDILDEDATFNPITPYGESKVWSERDILPLADDNFTPTFLRNATAYGMSPRVRSDVVVNNLVGSALTTGEVRLQTDGSQWRPLVHVVDICRAFLAVLQAPRDLVHAEAFNVGSTAENYQIRDVAGIVEQVVPNSRVVLAGQPGPDLRNYRVSCDKFADRLGFQTEWTVERGAREVFETFASHGFTLDDLSGPRTQRLARIRQLLADGRVDDDLRWRVGALAS